MEEKVHTTHEQPGPSYWREVDLQKLLRQSKFLRAMARRSSLQQCPPILTEIRVVLELEPEVRESLGFAG